ncbi:hypothetical protein ACFO9Q_00335 [Paenibacillus sp. GCM10023252]|uniref:DUF7507 domain-containing protein n=1 Tax=Paenibacillus sp. GCM10023252 TaxID=3252649 RepID=UPI003621F731
MPFVNRYFQNDNGAITFTGNTLGLSRSNTVGVPGREDSIGAFVTTNNSLTFGTYPAGTTNNFRLNRSEANLVLPAGSTILYAELIWGGCYINGGVDLSAFINEPVAFTTPQGTFNVSPDPATAFSASPSANVFFYVRTSDVTALIAAGGAGAYATAGVAGTIVIPDPTSNHAGWTLAVVYRDLNQPLRNLSLRAGLVLIQATQGPVDTVITGFATPFEGSLNGRAQISSQEGDANKTGDQALFGPTLNTITALSGPNNLADNFFASQINNDQGLLDTTGTFGLRNQINGNPGSNIIGGRQSWDITNVTISSTLVNNQTSALFQLRTSGDGYAVDGIGIQIDINNPILSVTKSANQIVALVGDTIEYSIVIQNNGSVTATKISFLDSQIPATDFIEGSVRVDGTVVPLADPFNGFPLPNLPPGGSSTVTFQATVTTVPNPNEIRDQAFVSYDFVPAPNTPPISTFVPSNQVKIPVIQPKIETLKTADRSSVQVGDTVTFTLKAENTGNVDLLDVTLDDSLPVSTSFIPGSVIVNGVSQPSANPAAGIPVGILPAGSEVIASFQAIVTSIPPLGFLRNNFQANYVFQVQDRDIPRVTTSNSVLIPVSAPQVTVTKAANQTSAIIGTVLTYTLNVTNVSLGPVTNVIVTDPIPEGSTFVAGSVTVSGVQNPSANPVAGIAVGSIPASATVPVTFQVTVVSVPSPNILQDQGVVQFTSGAFTSTSYSNVVEIPVFQPIITLVKRAGVSTAVVGETVNYSVTVHNSGNIAATVTVLDPLNAYSSFVPGTARVDGALVAGGNPTAGIVVNAAPNASVVVSYDVLLTSAPPTQFFDNQANASYTFQQPGGPAGSGNAVSNLVQIQNVSFTVVAVKSSAAPVYSVGEYATFTVALTNNGVLPASNVIVTDSATGGTQVPGSVIVNGIPQPTANLSQGYNIGTIPAGGTVTVTFQVDVGTSPPAGGTLSNFVTAQFTVNGVTQQIVSNTVQIGIIVPVITVTKRAERTYAFVGDVVQYFTEVNNSSNFNATATWFDIEPPGAVFLRNSLVLGVPIPGADTFTGLVLGTIEARSRAEVKFQFQVVSYPPTGQLVNQATMVFDFDLPSGRQLQQTVQSNQAIVQVLAPPTLVKSADVREVFVGGTVTFIIDISNPSLNPLEGATLVDLLPAGLQLVPDSVSYEGRTIVGANLVTGVPLGTIQPRSSTQLRFRALAVFEPVNSTVTNIAALTFRYVLPSGERVEGSAQTTGATVVITEDEE